MAKGDDGGDGRGSTLITCVNRLHIHLLPTGFEHPSKQKRVMTDINDKDALVWLNRVLSIDFKGRSIIMDQIRKAEVEIHECFAYVSILLKVPPDAERFPHETRVPVDMRVFRENAAPIVFLLHIMDGYARELEIITADSTMIDLAELPYQSIGYVIDKDLAFSGTSTDQ